MQQELAGLVALLCCWLHGRSRSTFKSWLSPQRLSSAAECSAVSAGSLTLALQFVPDRGIARHRARRSVQVVISVQEVSHVATAHLEFCGRALTARSQPFMQTDLAGTVWRDDMWLTTYPLNAQVSDWGLFAVWFHLLSGLNCNVDADSNRLFFMLTILGFGLQ